MAVIEGLLTEILRPKTLEDIILLPRIRKAIGKGNKINQNFIFHGNAGAGKTTLARILAKNHPTLYLNISADRGIDVVKEEITHFCSSTSLDYETDDLKYIILDEFDGATDQFFKALRATMERFHSNIRFIATLNYLNKIPDPIQSRFEVISFNPLSTEEENELLELYKKRVKNITTKLKMDWESDETLDYFLKKTFPDLRKVFQRIQMLHTSGIKLVKLSDIKNVAYVNVNVFQLIVSKPSPHENYKLIMSEYSNKLNDVIVSISQEFPDWLKENYPSKINKLPQILISAAEWDSKKNSMVDPILALLAMIFECQQIFNS